ncbi:MAG: type II toxin-antitoxin system HicB family antitoxin [Bacillota bacterium]|nr:type II toxin-antitoxin system HicB family antitoxin [Bacillota bacterium]
MKSCTVIASLLNEDEELWLAEILEVKGCKTQGKNLHEVIKRAEDLKDAMDKINGLQFSEEEPTEIEKENEDEDVLGYFLSHKNKANGSICFDINEVLGIMEEFDIVEDRGDKAFRRHLGIMLTHLSLEVPTLSIGPWTIQCKSIKRQLGAAPKWDGWKDKWNGNKETA